VVIGNDCTGSCKSSYLATGQWFSQGLRFPPLKKLTATILLNIVENDVKYLNPNPNLYYYIDKTHYTTTTTPNKFSEYHVPIYKFSIRKK
jgi:hypothetical protein